MKKSFLGVALVLGLLVLGNFVVKKEILKPLEISYTFNKPGETAKDTNPKTPEIINQVKKEVGEATGKYAIWVWRYKDNIGYGWREDEKMPLLSMIKVPIMAAVLRSVDEGKLTLDDSYVIKSEDIRDGSSFKAGEKLDVQRMLLEAGKKSDNTTPVALVKMIGEDRVREMLNELGMSREIWDTKEATTREVGEMWKRLYEKNILSNESKTLLWGYLTDSIYEDRIAKAITDPNITLVHKVATDLDVWADSGMIMNKDGSLKLVLVIMNRDVNRAESLELVPEIAKIIWDFEGLKDSAANPS